MVHADFKHSEQGEEAAWKGFSSQSLYILFRIITAEDDFDYYPEKLEDLMVKKEKKIIEVVQVKDYASNLVISDLDASTKSEGLFRRAISLRDKNANVIIRVAYFGKLGEELSQIKAGDSSIITSVKKKLCDKYMFSQNDAQWILSHLKFEKVNHSEINRIISEKIRGYVPTMGAPDLAYDLLAYYVFTLSRTKGKTSKYDWQEKVIQIGNDMASFDGYSREYGGSLLRLADISNQADKSRLEAEFRQGVSTRPEHIVNGCDLERRLWLDKVKDNFSQTTAVIIKGASGQGKTALAYRYLYNEFAPEYVFCIRRIKDQTQAENLIKAIAGLSKHYSDKLIIFIDVNPGESQWVWVLREAQLRSLKVKILVSIREEDYKLSNFDASLLLPKIIDLHLEKEEAVHLYDALNSVNPHPTFRTFAEAWAAFGEAGPLLEFVFLLKNNETLKQRLELQVRKLTCDSGTESEQWLALLRLVCYASKVGCPSLVADIKKNGICSNLFAALGRMTEEYLIRNTNDGRYLEALHPIRAKILYEILKDEILYPEDALLLSCLACSEKHFMKILVFHYFIEHKPTDSIIDQLTNIQYKDWEGFAGVLEAMIWLDIRNFISRNAAVFDVLIKDKGKCWHIFAPLDISNMLCPNEILAEQMAKLKPKLQEEALKIREKFVSMSIDYCYCDIWLKSPIPDHLPTYDIEWMYMGYVLFWMSKRQRRVKEFFSAEQLSDLMKIGTIEYKAAALQGFFCQQFHEIYGACAEVVIARVASEYSVIQFNQEDDCVTCRFIPPIFSEDQAEEEQRNFNHYWTMKMVNMLSRIYPTKPCIEVSLVGISLFEDLGIKAFDFEKKIPLENRPDQWITQINAYYKNLVEYKYRPNDWGEFIDNLMDLRREITDVLIGLINGIDCLYKKGYVKDTAIFGKSEILCDKLCHYQNLLPISCVDQFGNFSEMTTSDETSAFRTSIQDVFSSIQNYLNQFDKTLIARKNSQDINEFLSEINLYSATKSLVIMQKEFKKLFSQYLPGNYDGFETLEKDTYLTLLGVWNAVLRTPIRRTGSLSYGVKAKNKTIEQYLQGVFKQFLDSNRFPVTFLEGKNAEEIIYYFFYKCDLLEGIPIPGIYATFCLSLRKVFREAQAHNCFRWYLETQWPKMVFVPVIGKSYIGAFSLPIYKLLDIPDTELSKSLFPEIIPDEICTTVLNESEKVATIKNFFGELNRLRFLLVHYKQVVAAVHEDTNSGMRQGVQNWLTTLYEKINIDERVLGQFCALYYEPENIRDDDTINAIQTLCEHLNVLSNLPERLSKLEPVDESIDSIQTAMFCVNLLLAKA